MSFDQPMQEPSRAFWCECCQEFCSEDSYDAGQCETCREARAKENRLQGEDETDERMEQN